MLNMPAAVFDCILRRNSDHGAMQHESSFNSDSELIAHAIQARRLIRARYNSTELTLAPHQIILRNNALYLGAHNPAKKIRSDEEPGLGHFKIDGLSDVGLTDEAFEALPPESCQLPREDDQLIFEAE